MRRHRVDIQIYTQSTVNFPFLNVIYSNLCKLSSALDSAFDSALSIESNLLIYKRKICRALSIVYTMLRRVKVVCDGMPPSFFSILSLFFIISIATLYSAAGGSWHPWALNQVIRYGIGIGVMFFTMRLPRPFFYAWSYPFYFFLFRFADSC